VDVPGSDLSVGKGDGKYVGIGLGAMLGTGTRAPGVKVTLSSLSYWPSLLCTITPFTVSL